MRRRLVLRGGRVDQRLRHRRALARFLRDNPVLPSSRLSAAVRRLGATVEFLVIADRLTSGDLAHHVNSDVVEAD